MFTVSIASRTLISRHPVVTLNTLTGQNVSTSPRALTIVQQRRRQLHILTKRIKKDIIFFKKKMLFIKDKASQLCANNNYS